MKWEEIIPDIKSISAEEAKQTLYQQSTPSIQLVDVRQVMEYNQHHLPGAIPLPLLILTESLENLDKRYPVLLYSQKNNRALMAARWLESHEFKDLTIIDGGLDAWDGATAFGHFELNLNLLQANAKFSDAVSIAYAMEEGLRQFYILLAKQSDDDLYKELYRELAQYEVIHMQELASQYSIELGKNPLQDMEQKYGGQIMEGGGFINMSLVRSLAKVKNISRVFSLAQAFEVQALDFYYRLSLQAESEAVRSFFLEMADSERKHLAFVTEKLDTYLESNL